MQPLRSDRTKWNIGTLLIAIMLIGCVFCFASDNDAWAEQTGSTPAFAGNGTVGAPYRIEDTEDLEQLRRAVAEGNSFAGEYLQLMADISLPEGWEGLGTLKEGESSADNGRNILPFSGTLDGGGCTVTAADGGRPLFAYVRGAVIRNLGIAGKNINGSGLIRNYVIDKGESGNTPEKTATVENVTIHSGTSIRGSGFVSGNAAAANTVDIKNCTAEAGVIVGCNKDQSWIGSFGGNYNGRITGCRSAATVYGVNYVGGIIGARGNSMSDTAVRNCVFNGQVIASGNYAGGIAGGSYGGFGWGINTAPNAPMLSVSNCLCTGSVQAADVVGGIVGYETSLQVWETGQGYVQGNLFAGTAGATGGTRVGGITGEFRGLDRYNIIRDNYYAETCGANRGIGGAEYVDTSCADHETAIGVHYFNTGEKVPVFEGVNSAYPGNLKANHNRTDDPLGADGESLAKAVTSRQLSDGTVTAWMNGAAGSEGNWVQGESGPQLKDIPIVTGISVVDGYKAIYEIGEDLEPDTLEFTLTWSDGRTETIRGSDPGLTITGFDSSRQAVIRVTATTGSVGTEFPIRIQVPDSGDRMTVSFTLLGDTGHGPGAGGVHTRTGSNLTTWIPADSYQVGMNCTAGDLIRQVLAEKGLGIAGSSMNSFFSFYISGIQIPGTDSYLSEKDNGPNSGWMYAVNDEEPGIGVGEYFLENGDEVILFYTDDYTREKSSQPYNPVDPVDPVDPVEPDRPESSDGPAKTMQPGELCAVGGSTYVVTAPASAGADGTAALRKAAGAKAFVVPETVRLADGKTYRVTRTAARAFAAKKIRTVTIGANVTKLDPKTFAGSRVKTVRLKTARLNKSAVKGSLKGSKVRTVRVKVGSSKANRAFVKKYRKIFTKKNAGRKCRVR